MLSSHCSTTCIIHLAPNTILCLGLVHGLSAPQLCQLSEINLVYISRLRDKPLQGRGSLT